MDVFEYNSARDTLIMPEYGRHVQKMVRLLKTMEDPEKKQAYADAIVDLMIQMNPQNKSIDDYQNKMWRHLFHIAEYDLDVDTPTGEVPEPPSERTIQSLGYPKGIKYKHYGLLLLTMIKKAEEMEDGPMKDGFLGIIGSYMKMAHRNWNKDNFVDDSLIRDEIHKLSQGKLKVKDDVSFEFYNGVRVRQKRSTNHRSRHKGRSGRRRK